MCVLQKHALCWFVYCSAIKIWWKHRKNTQSKKPATLWKWMRLGMIWHSHFFIFITLFLRFFSLSKSGNGLLPFPIARITNVPQGYMLWMGANWKRMRNRKPWIEPTILCYWIAHEPKNRRAKKTTDTNSHMNLWNCVYIFEEWFLCSVVFVHLSFWCVPNELWCNRTQFYLFVFVLLNNE